MNVAELIEWLHTMPQDAVVQVLSHEDDGGYYMQGGSCFVEPFNTDISYQQWKDVGDTSPIEYIYGTHFELNKVGGKFELQLGVMNK